MILEGKKWSSLPGDKLVCMLHVTCYVYAQIWCVGSGTFELL